MLVLIMLLFRLYWFQHSLVYGYNERLSPKFTLQMEEQLVNQQQIIKKYHEPLLVFSHSAHYS